VSALQIIGGGKMGLALYQGLIAAEWADPADLVVVEASADQRAAIAVLRPDAVVVDSPIEATDAVLAVKPWSVVDVAASLVAPRRVLSIAAGVSIASIEAVVATGAIVIRCMPNTPALVGAGASALAAGGAASAADIEWAVRLLAAVGSVDVVTESQLDAVTGLSGSGPAYVFLVAEALTDAGVQAGLSRDVAERLANQTIFGAGKMLVETSSSAVELRAAVTTPAGTTAAGLGELERHALRAAFGEAVAAATARSRALGGSA
jgi:pyrroline-5-carboxylate reductase